MGIGGIGEVAQVGIVAWYIGDDLGARIRIEAVQPDIVGAHVNRGWSALVGLHETRIARRLQGVRVEKGRHADEEGGGMDDIAQDTAPGPEFSALVASITPEEIQPVLAIAVIAPGAGVPIQCRLLQGADAGGGAGGRCGHPAKRHPIPHRGIRAVGDDGAGIEGLAVDDLARIPGRGADGAIEPHRQGQELPAPVAAVKAPLVDMGVGGQCRGVDGHRRCGPGAIRHIGKGAIQGTNQLLRRLGAQEAAAAVVGGMAKVIDPRHVPCGDVALERVRPGKGIGPVRGHGGEAPLHPKGDPIGGHMLMGRLIHVFYRHDRIAYRWMQVPFIVMHADIGDRVTARIGVGTAVKGRIPIAVLVGLAREVEAAVIKPVGHCHQEVLLAGTPLILGEHRAGGEERVARALEVAPGIVHGPPERCASVGPDAVEVVHQHPLITDGRVDVHQLDLSLDPVVVMERCHAHALPLVAGDELPVGGLGHVLALAVVRKPIGKVLLGGGILVFDDVLDLLAVRKDPIPIIIPVVVAKAG